MFFFEFGRIGAIEVSGERVTPAAMFVECAINRSDHFRENLGMGPESRVNSFVDDGPEFFFHRRVSGVGGNENDFKGLQGERQRAFFPGLPASLRGWV